MPSVTASRICTPATSNHNGSREMATGSRVTTAYWNLMVPYEPFTTQPMPRRVSMPS